MNITPLYDRVLVMRKEPTMQTKGGIYIPDAAQDKPQEAEVMAVGAGVLHADSGKLTPLAVKPGDRILLSKWGGTEVKIDGKEYLIVKESDILAIVKA